MDKNKQIKNLDTDASLYFDDAKKEKLNALLKNNEVIDWEKKGNLVRFYLGKNGEQTGDDWNDAPWEDNGGTVYDRYVKGIIDICFPFDGETFEPISVPMDIGHSKDEMISRMLPCIVFAPQDLYDKYSWKGFNFFAMSNDTWKIYFGDHLTDYEKYGCVIINAEEKSND